jgi:hypothetical protein
MGAASARACLGPRDAPGARFPTSLYACELGEFARPLDDPSRIEIENGRLKLPKVGSGVSRRKAPRRTAIRELPAEELEQRQGWSRIIALFAVGRLRASQLAGGGRPPEHRDLQGADRDS